MGRFTGQLVLPAGEIDASPQTLTRWQTLYADFSGAADGVHVEGTMRWPEVIVHGQTEDPAQQVDLTMSGLRADFKSELPATGPSLMATGDARGSIDRIVAVRSGAQGAAATPLFAVDDLKIASKTTRDGALMSMLQTATGTGSIGQKPLEALSFELKLQRVDAEAYSQLQTLGSGEIGAAGVASEVNQARASALVERLIAAKPEYQVKVGATFMGRPGEVGVRVRLQPNASGATASPQGLSFLPTLLQSASAQLQFRLPKAWLPTLSQALDQVDVTPEAIAGMATPLVKQGLLADEGETYATDISYADGKLLVNGKPMRIPPAVLGR